MLHCNPLIGGILNNTLMRSKVTGEGGYQRPRKITNFSMEKFS